MNPIIFTIESRKTVTIGNLVDNDLFECASVSAKDASQKPSADSAISDFASVLFGVQKKSALGFQLSYDGETYQVTISPYATPSDWTGALLFLKLLLVILEEEYCQLKGARFTKETITDFSFNKLVLAGISTLTKELQVHPQIQLDGIYHPIHLN